MRILSFLSRGLFLFITLMSSEAALGEPLPAPVDIQIRVEEVNARRRVVMSYTPVPNAISYQVTRADNSTSNADFRHFAWVNAGQFMRDGNRWVWDAAHFVPGKKYFIKVASIRASTNTGLASGVVGPIDISLLSPPKNPTARLGADGRVIINFSAVPGALKYKVSRATDSSPNAFNHFAWVNRDLANFPDRLFWSRDFFLRNKVYFFKVSTLDSQAKEGPASAVFGPITTSSDASRGIPAELRIVNEDGSPLEGSSFQFSQALVGGSSRTQRFVIKNEGTVDATIFTLSGLTNPFSSNTLCTSVPARGSCNLDISFAAGVSGSFRNDLSILFNDGISWDRDSVNLRLAVSGQVTDPPLVTQVNPPVAASGQQVFLEGSGLNGVVSVEVGGVAVSAAPFLGKIVFTLPNGLTRGEKELKVNGVVQVPKIKIEPFCNPESVASAETESRNLAINHESILNHANAKFKSGDLANSTWSFGYLMGRIAGFSPQDPDFETKTAQFVETWANTFRVGIVNGHNFGGRNFLQSGQGDGDVNRPPVLPPVPPPVGPVFINEVFPQEGREGTVISIKGQNFVPGLMLAAFTEDGASSINMCVLGAPPCQVFASEQVNFKIPALPQIPGRPPITLPHRFSLAFVDNRGNRISSSASFLYREGNNLLQPPLPPFSSALSAALPSSGFGLPSLPPSISGGGFGEPSVPGSGGMSWPRKPSGILDLENAPMRLIAIMYRPDLAEEGRQAGEGRFVYEVGGSSFTVILEYGLAINEANSAADWAKRWADLSDHQLGSPKYAEALKTVTSFFGDQRFSGRPNGSAINQVRTNEIALGSPWQLREWTLQSRDGGLENVALLPATVKQTPKPDLSPFDRERLQNWWMNESCSGSSNPVEGCSDLMPSEFLAGAANTDGRSFGIGPDPVKFDMITCNGCHDPQRTAPQSFVHVSRFGGFSNFLRSDLVQRRAAFRDALVNGFCK